MERFGNNGPTKPRCKVEQMSVIPGSEQTFVIVDGRVSWWHWDWKTPLSSPLLLAPPMSAQLSNVQLPEKRRIVIKNKPWQPNQNDRASIQEYFQMDALVEDEDAPLPPLPPPATPPPPLARQEHFKLCYVPAMKRQEERYKWCYVPASERLQMDKSVEDDVGLELPTQAVGHLGAEVDRHDESESIAPKVDFVNPTSAQKDPTSATVDRTSATRSVPTDPTGHRSLWSDVSRTGKGSREGKSTDGVRGAGGPWYRRRDGRKECPEAGESEVFGEQTHAAGMEINKYDDIKVEVSGNRTDEVVPIGKFSEAGLDDLLLDNIGKCGYKSPTPIQKYSIPTVLAGRDLMASALTGSGKTCAFMVPCLESLLRKGPPATSGRLPRPCGLVLAPTRELAGQIHEQTVKFSFRTGIRSCYVGGGASFGEQRKELEQGCDILVATPGRLTAMCESKCLSLSLVHFLVLDEADRMLDQGFAPQIRQIVEHTDMVLRKSDRQSMMFSATFKKEVQLMAMDFMTDYLFITAGKVGAAAQTITQKLVYAEEPAHRLRKLEQALKDHLPVGGLAVVFVNKKDAATDLEVTLYNKGMKAAAIHGDRDQGERNAAMSAFRSGKNPILVATDVVGRGLDIDDIRLVVNFDMPHQIDDYVHRIGRTGRAGRLGVAVSLINSSSKCLPELRQKLAEAKQEVPHWFEDLCKHGQGHRRQETSERSSSDARITLPPALSAVKKDDNGFGNTGQTDAW